MKINIVPLEENHKLLNCPGNVQNNEMFSSILNGLSFGLYFYYVTKAVK